MRLLDFIRNKLQPKKEIELAPELLTFHKITNAILSTVNFDKVIQLVVNTIAVHLDSRGGTILLMNHKGKEICSRAYSEMGYVAKALKVTGLPIEKLTKLRVAIDAKTLVTKTIKTKRLQIGHDLREFICPPINRKIAFLMQRVGGVRAIVTTPVIAKNKVIGAILMTFPRKEVSKKTLELLKIFADQAGIAIENARLYEQTQEAYQIEKKARIKTEKAAEELKRLNEAKTQFIMATQHHLRTPLTAIKGYISMLLEGTFGKISPKVKKKLGAVLKSTNKLIKLVNEFLDISQFQLGKEILNKKEINIEGLISQIIKELRDEVEQKHLYLRFKKSTITLPRIQADPQKLQVALFNIIDNGIKYTDKGGVTITLKVEKLNLVIAARDTGIGLAPEEERVLFTETFERGRAAKKTYALGRGIGLFIASNIIKAHRGKLWAKSPGKGKGSTFYIELPICQKRKSS